MKNLLMIAAFIAVFSLSANAQKVYNFNDDSWGEAVTERPESGTFNSGTINGVKFNKTVLFQKDGKGVKRMILDKMSKKGSIEFPEAGKEVIIEASVGTDGNPMIVREMKNGKWSDVGEPILLTKKQTAYTVKLSEGVTQVCVANGSSSSLYIYKVTIN